MKLIIDRNKWLRGEGFEASKLLRPADGKMCCLGMLALQSGATEDQISGRASPRKASEVAWPKGLTTQDRDVDGLGLTDTCNLLMEINDQYGITNDQREQDLVEIFQSIDIEVEFVN
jgi:hypothetical protein